MAFSETRRGFDTPAAAWSKNNESQIFIGYELYH